MKTQRFWIYQTNPVTGDRLAFGPFTWTEVLLVTPHCGGKRMFVASAVKPKYPCLNNGDDLRRTAGIR